MRHLVLFAAAAVSAAACSGDGSSSSPSDPNNPEAPPTVYVVTLDSGVVDSITAPAGSIVPVRVHVTSGGIPVPAMTVAWTVGTGHGALSAPSTSTDTLGVTSILWTLGDTVGLNSITAVAGDGSVTWRVAAIAGAASTLVKVSADSDAIVAGGTLPLTARVLDRHGNPVAGATVEWSSSGGELSVKSAPTGATGDAGTNFTAPSAAGTYTITASLPGRASVTFEIVAM